MKLEKPLNNVIPDIMHFSGYINKTGAQNNAQ